MLVAPLPFSGVPTTGALGILCLFFTFCLLWRLFVKWPRGQYFYYADGLMQQYTNEITPEIREAFSQPPYDNDFFALCDSHTRDALEKINQRAATHILTHMFRFAVVGSLTRNGGVIRHASGNSTVGGYKMARVGDKVVYADGSEATIISGAGSARIMQGASAALVGSMLDNGDEIISTPQYGVKLAFREGDVLPEGLLAVPGRKQ